MDVYDEVDRRETDAGRVLPLTRGLKCIYSVIHTHSSTPPLALQLYSCLKQHSAHSLQCGWQHRITARWSQRQLWFLSFLWIRSIHRHETRQVSCAEHPCKRGCVGFLSVVTLKVVHCLCNFFVFFFLSFCVLFRGGKSLQDLMHMNLQLWSLTY